MKLTVSEVIEATGGQLIAGDKWRIINGVSTDSRTVKPGQLFIALIGERYDGHDFIDNAVTNGASAVMLSKDTADWDIPIIKVEDTLEALKRLAAYYRRMFYLTVVAITGSSGKTTTKEFIYAVLSQKYNVLKNRGNLNNQIGLPLTVFDINPHHQYAVLEMGMSALGEIHDLADIARPHIGVITNIGLSHIEKLGNQQNILRAKLELFDFFGDNDVAVLNGDDPLLCTLHSVLPCRVLYFSTRGKGDIKVLNIRLYKNGYYCYTAVLPDGQREDIYLNIAGFHNVYNSLAAVLVGMEANVPLKQIKAGIESLYDTPQRLRMFQIYPDIQLIDDTYNANPDSMRAAIEVLCDLDSARKIAVLGDMLELGGIAETAHTELGRIVAQKRIDVLVTVGRLAHFIADGAEASGMDAHNIYRFNSNDDAISWLDEHITHGDAILIKGSHGMHMDEIVKYLQEHDEGAKNA
ncbi:UDP-N-acetylmuramoyl-tripeptide--D-alanyl-D-alanine ligase [Mahella australiensis]|uniref:UDP-N-acetylmuramoyl-tripeptide--D-alanyl-D-alanine ligase n=1 Tax=Mahella australiensis (strain DSM 15567 / CIP 107919 / 50-1 BON) TaxID=697281 RepID=F3ZZ23_MAHA5|nr:UDP-N-acetylmuramoyl-tripeptide--D-alanyl-D-alanine ligase [Mahella australiensis]AEE96782.1 UDP-N-acetylmuramoylalanyl-D-glutamyl-2,6-diaminopimelate/D-alanyl-D-alanyl ligase [Mahella australiensis 50-1 BON]